MAWSIIKKGGPGKIPTYREFIVDTENDIATLPIIPALPAGCKAYCSENGNTYVLETDGDWVVKSQGGGSGGASALAELTDVDISNPEANQILTYDAVEEKWINNSPDPYPGYDVIIRLDIDPAVSIYTAPATLLKGNREVDGAKALDGLPVSVAVYCFLHGEVGTTDIGMYNSNLNYYVLDYNGALWQMSGDCNSVSQRTFTFEIIWEVDDSFTVNLYNIE